MGIALVPVFVVMIQLARDVPGWCGASLFTAGVVTVIVFPGIAALALKTDGKRAG